MRESNTEYKPELVSNETNLPTDNFKGIEIKFHENGWPSIELYEALRDTNAQIVFIQDIHEDKRIRVALSFSVAKKLAAQGFKHYLVEAPSFRQELFDQLGKGKPVQLYDIPYVGPSSFGDKTFADAVYSMHGAGMKVTAIDYDASYDFSAASDAEAREAHMYTQIKKVLTSGERCICLIGSFHASLGEIETGVASTAQRLANDNYQIVSIKLS